MLSYAIADPGGPDDTGAVRGDSIQPKGNVVVEIQLAETDRLDWALKQFRRRMIRSGLFKDMRRKRFYEKPSEARKAKAKAAERRRHKDRKRARAAGRFGL
jgi:small subunit ribosomal protein S21